MSFLFRKRRSTGGEQGKLPTPAGIQSMDESLQKKFSKGIQFNIKILVRGDRNTGKTCLFHRMKGKAFTEAYMPTNEIQVTSILWSYRVTNDTVKVEVWDIVDKGKAQKKSSKSLLKMFNEPASEADPSEIPLDAEFMDVYKGAHGVVFTYDMTKQWTWKYIEREVPRVPLHIPIIVLGNFRDMEEHRVISSDEAKVFIHGLSRPEGAAPVRYAECSMKNGYGLTHLHKFLSVPFLQLQQEMLLQQLQVNREQTLAAQEELDSAGKSEDQNYDMFMEKIQRLTEERKRKMDHPPQEDHTPSTGGDSPRTPSSRRNTLERTQEDTPTSPPVGVVNEPQRSGSSKLFSGWFSRSKEEAKSEETTSTTKPRQAGMTIDDFVPEGGEVDSFLEDSDEGSEEEDSEEDSEEEPDGGNPQVTMDEDLSSPEEEAPHKAPPLVQTETPPTKRAPVVKKSLKSAKEIVLTESETESEGPEVMEDEDVSLEGLTISKPPVKSLDELFEVPQKKAAKTKKKKAREETVEPVVLKPPKKSGGLLLEFSPSSTPAKQPTPPQAESPEVVRKDSKRKKKSKKRKEPKEVEVAKSEETSGDPFGAIASLDAWLNSDSAAKKDEGWSSSGAIKTVEVAEEEDSAEEHREREKRPKKHKRQLREEGEERARKKKHKHKSSTRHRTEEEDRDYEAF